MATGNRVIHSIGEQLRIEPPRARAAPGRVLHKLLDLILTVAAFGMASYLPPAVFPSPLGELWPGPERALIALMIVIVWHALLSLYGPYRTQQRPRDAFGGLAKTVSLGVLIVAGAFQLLGIGGTPGWILLGHFYALDLAFLWASWLAFHRLRQNRASRNKACNVLVVGSKHKAIEVIHSLIASTGREHRVVGCLDPDETRRGLEVYPGVRVIGSMGSFLKTVLDQSIDEIIFAIPMSRLANPEPYMEAAERVGVRMRFVPEWGIYQSSYRPRLARVSIDGSAGIQTLTLSSTPSDQSGLWLKDVFDRVMAALGLVVGFPIFVFIAVGIKLSSKGPAFFKQTRSGLNGRKFVMYKFRTMVENAEELRESLEGSNDMDGPVFKLASDPRVTAFGGFLRRTSLDELPQLVNVVKGEMSLVGPRPPLPDEVERYELWQRRRLSMKPGLTCIWQVSGRNKVGFENWMRMDLQYIDHWSWGLDVKLLLKTVKVVLLALGDNPRRNRDQLELPKDRGPDVLRALPAAPDGHSPALGRGKSPRGESVTAFHPNPTISSARGE